MITTRARAMRKAMTGPEVILWTRLRGRGGGAPTFRRQHPFGAIILDLYCPRLRLAIEVDGATHWGDDAQLKDAARDRWLAEQGVQVLRIPASRVYHDLQGVMDGIHLKIAEQERKKGRLRRRSPPPPTALRCARRPVPLPPLRGGGKRQS